METKTEFVLKCQSAKVLQLYKVGYFKTKNKIHGSIRYFPHSQFICMQEILVKPSQVWRSENRVFGGGLSVILLVRRVGRRSRRIHRSQRTEPISTMFFSTGALHTVCAMHWVLCTVHRLNKEKFHLCSNKIQTTQSSMIQVSVKSLYHFY